MDRPSRLRRFLINGSLVLASVVLSALTAEGIVRAAGFMKPVDLVDGEGESLYEPHTDLGYKLRANASAPFQAVEFSTMVRTNSHGYRDEAFEDDPELLVIAGLGDSFAWGHGVDQSESFFQVAEAGLRKSNSAVRVHNLAVSGYSQIQHNKQIGLARDLNAKVCVIAYCAANDPLENGGFIVRGLNKKNRRSDVTENPEIASTPEPPEASWLEQRSHLYKLVLSRWGRLNPRVDINRAAWYRLEFMKEHPAPKAMVGLERTAELFSDIQRQCEAHGIELVVVAIPLAYMVSPERFEATARGYDVPLDEMDPKRPISWLAQLCADKGIPFLNGADVLERASDRPERYFYPQDRHLNVRGHAAIGEAMVDFLRPIVNKSAKESVP